MWVWTSTSFTRLHDMDRYNLIFFYFWILSYRHLNFQHNRDSWKNCVSFGAVSSYISRCIVPHFLYSLSIFFRSKCYKRCKKSSRDEIYEKERGNMRTNVTSRRVRPNIVAVEKQWVLHILNVCVCVCEWVCVSVRVALGTQHAMRMRHAVICDMPGSTIFFHIIS